MNEKVIVESKRKSILAQCIIIALLGPIAFCCYMAWSLQSYWDQYYYYSPNPEYLEMNIFQRIGYSFKADGGVPVMLLVAILTIVVALILYRNWSKVRMTVTDKRVYGVTSGGKRVDLPLDSISAVGQVKGSAIAVTTASGALKFAHLANAEELHQAISTLLVQRQDRSEEYKKPAANSSADELKKYKELLDSGVITQEEFDKKKKQLLGL